MLKCSTSLWSADLADLAAAIKRVEPHSERFHLDVADGHYSPTLLFFPDLVAALRPHTDLPLEIHLMTTDPAAWIDPFADAGADAILVDGDVGDSRVDLEANLGRLARSGIPVLAMVGNREGRVDFERAVDAVRAEHPAVFNLNHIRLVNTPVADLVTLPGYNDRNFVHKSDGCVYDSNELQFLTGVLADADSPVVLVAHSSHKMEGEDAVDHAIDTGNIGNPDLREWVQENKVHFGIYANAQEAGGRGTDLSGSRVIKPGTAVGELFVNPGPAMSDPWTMNDRSESRGMGMVATFAANKLSYQVIRSEQAAAAE